LRKNNLNCFSRQLKFLLLKEKKLNCFLGQFKFLLPKDMFFRGKNNFLGE
jgi:hypothetical protein